MTNEQAQARYEYALAVLSGGKKSEISSLEVTHADVIADARESLYCQHNDV